MKKHVLKNCQKTVQVSAVYRGPAKRKQQASCATRQRGEVAALTIDGQGERSRRAVLLGGSFGGRDSDSEDLNRFISENTLRRGKKWRQDIIIYFGIDSQSICKDKIKSSYINKSSSPWLLFLIAGKML